MNCMSTMHGLSYDYQSMSELCILTDSKTDAKSAPKGALMLLLEHLVILSLSIWRWNPENVSHLFDFSRILMAGIINYLLNRPDQGLNSTYGG